MPKPTKQQVHTKPKKKTDSILDRIVDVADYDSGTGITMSLYGRSGTGKTTLSCTFPKPLLLIGFESGQKSVRNVKGVKFVRVTDSEQVGDLAEHVANSGSYESVVLSTASSLQDMILKEILGLQELPAQKSWGMASREEYGQCALQTKERLRSIITLAERYPINVVVEAQERNFNDEGTASDVMMPTVGSALSPSVTGWLNPAVDYIGQTFIREQVTTKTITIGKKTKQVESRTGKKEFCLRTGPDEMFTTKFRLTKGTPLPPVIVDPTYDKIVAIINGG